MITHKTGDLLDFFNDGDADFIAHCCNCQGVMGSGIALSIKQDYPEAYQAYKDYENDHGLSLGTISGDMGIFNLHAQNLYNTPGTLSHNRCVDYEALYVCLERAKSAIEGAMDNAIADYVPTIGFPKNMGADRAGGDWNVIEAMIKSVFDGSGIDVLIVEFDGTRNK